MKSQDEIGTEGQNSVKGQREERTKKVRLWKPNMAVWSEVRYEEHWARQSDIRICGSEVTIQARGCQTWEAKS